NSSMCGVLMNTRYVGINGEEVLGFRICGVLGIEALERDDLADERPLGDARLVHLCHPAAAEKLQDLEAPEPGRGPTGLAHAGPVSGARKASGPAARTENGVASELDTVAESTPVPRTARFRVDLSRSAPHTRRQGGFPGSSAFPCLDCVMGWTTSCPIAVHRGPGRRSRCASSRRKPIGEA